MSSRALAILALLSTAGLLGCPKTSTTQGGITIPQNDGTPPQLSFGVGHQSPGSGNASVSTGGADQTMQLTAKAGLLNLLATAKDPESGVQAVQIWMSRKQTTCSAGICSTAGPGLLGAPLHEMSSPKKNPGETASDASILAQTLDLSTVIPQSSVPAGSSRTVQLTFYAESSNHLGGQSKTPNLTVTWKEP
jgi:hypothetical protein